MNQRDLGIVLNFEHANPATDTDADRAAADRYDGIYNRWFVEALFSGKYPDIVLEGLGAYMPEGFENDMETIAAPLDWLGVNYYTRSNLRHVPDAMWPALEAVPGALDKTDMGWEIYPEGLRAILTRLHGHHTRDLPIYVTENGMAGSNETGPGTIDDAVRTNYFDTHLEAVRGAIDDGVPVKGYFAWSLLDNYEWSFGYGKRFGIVHVDYATQKRTPKASYQAFREALSGR